MNILLATNTDLDRGRNIDVYATVDSWIRAVDE